MSDADLLRSLRDKVLDESESLVGLLRTCIALGALTGSDDLRAWANNELKGYPDDAKLPDYRLLDAPLFINQMGGNQYVTGQTINRLQIPADLRDYVPATLDFRQPVEELSQLVSSGDEYITMSRSVFLLVAAQWTKKLGPWQSVNAIYYKVATSALAGMVGMIRTTLLEIVIDLAKDVPLDKLPSQAKVDSVVQVHVGSKDNYEVSIGTNTGIVSQGAGSTLIQNNSAPDDLNALIGKMREALAGVSDDDHRADAEQAIDDFEESVSEDDPKPEKIKRRSRILEKIAKVTGSAVLSGAAKEGIELAAQHFHLIT